MSKIYPKGLTLFELLLAAAILAFVLCGVLVFFVNCLFLNEANRNLTLAMSHAQYVMEEIRGADFSDIELKINKGDWDLDEDEIQSANLGALSDENIDTTVKSGNPLEISVKVNWKDRGQRQKSAELQTLITDYQ